MRFGHTQDPVNLGEIRPPLAGFESTADRQYLGQNCRRASARQVRARRWARVWDRQLDFWVDRYFRLEPVG
jgi:hypothetical protein